MAGTLKACALEQARETSVNPNNGPAASRVRPTRRVAVGDPQTSADTFFSVLAAHDLLASSGWLRPEVQLVSMGDHFDFPVKDGSDATETQDESGRMILSWLAAHPRGQVDILLGNHDVMRVQELFHIDDTDFGEARRRARAGESEESIRGVSTAIREHVPETDNLLKDFAGFKVAQRELVSRLLRDAQRMVLAVAGRLPGTNRPVLLTHAGITHTELTLLGQPDNHSTLESATEHVHWIVERLNGHLAAAVAAWSDAPLDLEPLHRRGGVAARGEACSTTAQPARRSSTSAPQIADGSIP